MAAKPKFNARKPMEKAIEVMKQSIAEGRDDGKASPLVGAVLVKPDGTVDTAFRGELRHGDHAEYTLLERKHRDDRLDGSFLFATLEPCAPGARKHPKLACAGMKLPYRTAMNHLKKFNELGLLERTGSARATEYKARKP